MKTKGIFKLLLVAILMGNNTGIMAQAVATSGVSANVIVPIGIVKNADMNFGNASVSASVGGGVVLGPGGSRGVTGSGVTLPATLGTVTSAGFTVTGAPGYTFAITLPGSTVISGPGSATMVINGFTSSPSGTGTLGTGGSQYLSVGATLNVASAQSPGTYVNLTAVPISVNYN